MDKGELMSKSEVVEVQPRARWATNESEWGNKTTTDATKRAYRRTPVTSTDTAYGDSDSRTTKSIRKLSSVR